MRHPGLPSYAFAGLRTASWPPEISRTHYRTCTCTAWSVYTHLTGTAVEFWGSLTTTAIGRDAFTRHRKRLFCSACLVPLSLNTR